MSTRNETGVKGGMNLYHYFYESASGHIEDSEDISLKAKDEKTVQLIEGKSHSEIHNYHRNTDEEAVYEIEVSKLIEFIKQNGKKIK
jgi:hypothetical protein